MASKKRTLDSFFQPAQPKKPRLVASSEPASSHSTYPFAVQQLPPEIVESLGFAPAEEPEAISNLPDLDLLYFKPYIPKNVANDLFRFLRKELFFYRVQYKIKRGTVETEVNTPRYTTVFGVDESACFSKDGSLLDAKTKLPLPGNYYGCQPRPIPGCLDLLRTMTEASTGEKFNFCLVNYYASGDDSISYHSDDERFLGTNPAIASYSLGATRDFLMKRKPAKDGIQEEGKPLKFALGPGDMVLMRGRTQSNWLHSIPKRKAGDVGSGRINITFRRAMIRGGTENYYQYNVGGGGAFMWNETQRRMDLIDPVSK